MILGAMLLRGYIEGESQFALSNPKNLQISMVMRRLNGIVSFLPRHSGLRKGGMGDTLIK